MLRCKWAFRALLALCGMSLFLNARAEVRPLNADGTAGDSQAVWDVVERIKGAVPPVQDRYLDVKSTADYAALKQSPEWRRLRAETARLRAVNLQSLSSPSAKTAFWINVYNVLVADGIVSLRVRSSVQKTRDFFRSACYDVGGAVFNLEEIEHGLLRGNRPPEPGQKPLFDASDPRLAFAVAQVDPRIHFALNCGARSCPPVRIYTAEKLDAQLDSAARNFINGPDVRVNEGKHILFLSQIFEWYATDFGSGKKEVMLFISRYLKEPAKTQLLSGLDALTIRYLPYDWALADKSS